MNDSNGQGSFLAVFISFRNGLARKYNEQGKRKEIQNRFFLIFKIICHEPWTFNSQRVSTPAKSPPLNLASYL
jgi:hypothetical protein